MSDTRSICLDGLDRDPELSRKLALREATRQQRQQLPLARAQVAECRGFHALFNWLRGIAFRELFGEQPDTQPAGTEDQIVARSQRHRLIDALPVDERTVAAAEVL